MFNHVQFIRQLRQSPDRGSMERENKSNKQNIGAARMMPFDEFYPERQPELAVKAERDSEIAMPSYSWKPSASSRQQGNHVSFGQARNEDLASGDYSNCVTVLLVAVDSYSRRCILAKV